MVHNRYPSVDKATRKRQNPRCHNVYNLYTNLKISSDTLSLQLKLCYLDNRDELLFTNAVTIDAIKAIPVHTSHYHHLVRVKQVNSDIHLQTVDIQMRREDTNTKVLKIRRNTIWIASQVKYPVFRVCGLYFVLFFQFHRFMMYMRSSAINNKIKFMPPVYLPN